MAGDRGKPQSRRGTVAVARARALAAAVSLAGHGVVRFPPAARGLGPRRVPAAGQLRIWALWSG